MNWEAIGAVGEIVGAIAVVATLLYLSLQVRQTTKAVTSNTHQIHIDAWNAMSSLVIENREVADLMSKSETEISALAPANRVQFEWLATKVFALWEHVFTDISAGLMDDSYSGAFESYYRDLTSKAAFTSFWNDHRHWYYDGFVAHVDREHASAPAPTGDGPVPD